MTLLNTRTPTHVQDLFQLLGKKIRDSGHVCVNVGYRRYPFAPTVWQSSEDVGAAISFISANIARYGGDPNQIILMAHSSGAHISALHLLQVAARWLDSTTTGLHTVTATAQTCG